MTLLEFLEARLAEDEAVARAATPGPWEVDHATYAELISSGDGTAVVAGGRWGGEASVFDSTDDALHIARFNPARVLAEVEMKQQLIDVLLGYEGGIDGEFGCCHKADDIAAGECPETPVDEIDGLRMLAAPYASHPDYRAEWAVVPAS